MLSIGGDLSMRMKKTVSVMIFSSLFLGAWYIQEQEEKKNTWTSKNLPEPSGMNNEVAEVEAPIEAAPVADFQEEMGQEPLGPREYIRFAK
jgi:hypothetical protein